MVDIPDHTNARLIQFLMDQVSINQAMYKLADKMTKGVYRIFAMCGA